MAMAQHEQKCDGRGNCSVDPVEEDETWDLPAYPDEGQIVNPCVPYTGALPLPLAPRQMIVLDGKVLPQANRFAVDLICGLTTRCDVALHLNPRFDERRIVCNSRTNEHWDEEVSAVAQKFPLRRGEQFFLYIFVSETQFLIAVNGRHYCAFTHRMPLWRVHAMHITGDLKIFQIEHRRNVNEYPQPSPTSTTFSLAVPTPSCPANLDKCCTHITNPEIPFLCNLPLGLNVGLQIEIIGRVKILPHSFYINLQQGSTIWPPPNILFHLNPRFKEGHIVVRNSRIGADGWGQEERSGPPCPFEPGLPFLITIVCAEQHFDVYVNGLPFVRFKYRGKLCLVNTVVIEGDLTVSDIYIR